VAGEPEQVVWVSEPGVAVVRRVDLLRRTEDLWEADGRDLAVTPGGTVWATRDTRLLGLGGPQVRGPRRNLHELKTDRITAAAAADDGGLWLGTPQGLFHVDQSVLGQR
jgi:ligand-binding sensor domain-containing protein